MGQCPSNHCHRDLCRDLPEGGSAPKAKSSEGQDSIRQRLHGDELPEELAGALLRAVASIQATRPGNLNLTKSAPLLSRGVQTEPLTPETEVLPELFFVPDGEPWELVQSDTGSEPASEAEEDHLGGLHPAWSEELMMSGLLPEPPREPVLLDVSADAAASVLPEPHGDSAPEQQGASEQQGPSLEAKDPAGAPKGAPTEAPSSGPAAPPQDGQDKGECQKFLLEHEGIWLRCSDQDPVAALKDQKLWRRDDPNPTHLEALPDLKVQIVASSPSANSAGPSVASILREEPPRLKWSDGSIWVREELQGVWKTSSKARYSVVIRGWKVYWDRKLESSPTQLSMGPIFPNCTVTMLLDAGCQGVYDAGPPSKLKWSDGEVWTRSGFEKASVRLEG
ncbi:unnamed protein product [Durusdinium trenchii]|uniref:Uncharacterized protein n=2 Tax=Durusdinium trenchii TaxID=1381693 RepID=A0ABP0JFN7_9DINO